MQSAPVFEKCHTMRHMNRSLEDHRTHLYHPIAALRVLQCTSNSLAPLLNIPFARGKSHKATHCLNHPLKPTLPQSIKLGPWLRPI